MRINSIDLHNFGSYEGHNHLDLSSHSDEQRVVIIGGKNGAGKTTLFTAVQVCLYGNYAFGYKTSGKRYLNEVYTLINNQARLNDRETAHIEIEFQQIDNTDLFNYKIQRSWTWPNNELEEHLSVFQNGIELNDDQLVNFQNYLIHLIPPDMLKLYFFDGEKIADYFLSNKEVNIRDALMVLSGNDTFDLLYDHVKHVLRISDSTQGGTIAQDYLSQKTKIADLQAEIQSSTADILALQCEIDDLNAEITRHKQSYIDHGGITLDDWTALHSQLKDEEEKRERLNWQRKQVATDVLPFLLLPSLIAKIPQQIELEHNHQAYQALIKRITEPGFSQLLYQAVNSIGSSDLKKDQQTLLSQIHLYFHDDKLENFSPLLGLSNDEEVQVRAIISRVSEYKISEIKRYQSRIDSSIEHSKQIREKLQSTSVEHFEAYMRTLLDLEERKKLAELQISHIQELLEIKGRDYELLRGELNKLKIAFSEQLKSQSVSSIAGKVLLLLEDLQSVLYGKLIEQVEHDLNIKFRELIRKKDFFSYISIDSAFNVHILRNQYIAALDLQNLLKSSGTLSIKKILGTTALDTLQRELDVEHTKSLAKAIATSGKNSFYLPVEIDKEQLSSGEKQIFVMSLYWSMMNQSKNDLPFIIDTPFARIDAEHRANITEYFFKRLTGQLLILSTDEELSNNHLSVMKQQISHTYMLEYGADKQTHIHQNQYFEV